MLCCAICGIRFKYSNGTVFERVPKSESYNKRMMHEECYIKEKGEDTMKFFYSEDPLARSVAIWYGERTNPNDCKLVTSLRYGRSDGFPSASSVREKAEYLTRVANNNSANASEWLQFGLMRCWSCKELRSSADGNCNLCGADEVPF